MGYSHASTCCCPQCRPKPPEPPEPLVEVEPPHVSELYAALAAKNAKIARLREELAEALKVIEELADVLHSVDENTAADFLDSVESKARAFLARKETKRTRPSTNASLRRG